MPRITGYNWGSVEFSNVLERYYTEPPKDTEFFDPVAEAELAAEYAEAQLLAIQEGF